MSKKKSPGQPKTDIAQRSRAYCFQQSLKHRSGLSNEELDERFIVNPAKRLAKEHGYKVENYSTRRTFERVEIFGRDIDAKTAKKQRRFSVVEMVENDPDPKIRYCAEVYRSPFWDLITPPAPTPNELEVIINESLRRLSLFRVRDEEVPAGNRFAEDRAPYDWTMHDTYAKNLHAIADRGDFDCLTLLCALYYEGLLHNATFQLDVIEREIQWCVMRCEFWYSLKKEAQLLLEWLCHNRIICSRWDPLPDPERRAKAHRKVNQRRAKDRLKPANEKNFEIDRMALRLYNSTAHHRYPVVPLTDELLHIRANLAALNQQIEDEDWFPDSFKLPGEA